jgi:hypothetical protein
MMQWVDFFYFPLFFSFQFRVLEICCNHFQNYAFDF